MKLDTKPYEERMKKTISVFAESLKTIRAGRANAAVLSKVTMDYYGSETLISTMAEIKATDARTLVISPWDKTTLKAMERAILASDVGITPQNDGTVIRMAFPPLTEDRRRELTKQTAKMAEETKVALRNIRRDANDDCKNKKKNSEMTEDEQKQSEKLIQDITDRYIKEADTVVADKNREIMEI